MTIFILVYLVKYFEIFLLELMATNFSPSSGSYVLNKFPSISQWSDTGPSWPSCFICHDIVFNLWLTIMLKPKSYACLRHIDDAYIPLYLFLLFKGKCLFHVWVIRAPNFYLVGCMVFNAVFNSVSVISRWPAHLSMLFLELFSSNIFYLQNQLKCTR